MQCLNCSSKKIVFWLTQNWYYDVYQDGNYILLFEGPNPEFHVTGWRCCSCGSWGLFEEPIEVPGLSTELILSALEEYDLEDPESYSQLRCLKEG